MLIRGHYEKFKVNILVCIGYRERNKRHTSEWEALGKASDSLAESEAIGRHESGRKWFSWLVLQK